MSQNVGPLVMKVITLNIWFGGMLFDKVVDYLKKEDAEILLLQEVYDGNDQSLDKRYQSFSLLKEVLGYKYAHFAPAFLDSTANNIRVNRGNAILTKFPITHAENIFFDIPYSTEYKDSEETATFAPRNLQHVTLVIKSMLLDVFNIHGIWGLDGEDNQRRLAMSTIIVDAIRKFPNVLLGGDFNVKPNTQTIANIERYLTNIFKNELVSTFNMKYKKANGFSNAVVDMIFISKSLRVDSKMQPIVDISDHFPLKAVLSYV